MAAAPRSVRAMARMGIRIKAKVEMRIRIKAKVEMRIGSEGYT